MNTSYFIVSESQESRSILVGYSCLKISNKVAVKLLARLQLFQGITGTGKCISKLMRMVVDRPWVLAGFWPKI